MLLEKTVSLADVQPEIPSWIHTDDLLKNPGVSFSDGFLEEGLMDQKYSECSELFIESLTLDGQQAPVLIDAHSAENDFFVINGHHRLAVAARHNLPVLVLIIPAGEEYFEHWDASESDYYPDSQDW